MNRDSNPSEAINPPSTWPGPVFATTHWSVVLSAQTRTAPEAEAALEHLCRLYWRPLYTFVRRSGKSPQDAEDLTQGFFARLLEKDYLLAASREKGRFRTFLLIALKRYMSNEWHRESAQKRGGRTRHIPMDIEMAESSLAMAPPRDTQPDLLYDREWAQTLLTRALGFLKEEYVQSGRAELFDYIQNCLARNEDTPAYATIARCLNLSEAAIKMAVLRLRSRYRDLLLQEVAQTVSSPEEADDEIRQLFNSF